MSAMFKIGDRVMFKAHSTYKNYVGKIVHLNYYPPLIGYDRVDYDIEILGSKAVVHGVSCFDLTLVEGPKTNYHAMYDIVIKDVIFNDPATIVMWQDGSKTVVKCGPNEKFDPEKGLAMAMAKKMYGNHGNYYNLFKKWIPKEKEERPNTKKITMASTGEEFYICPSCDQLISKNYIKANRPLYHGGATKCPKCNSVILHD